MKRFPEVVRAPDPYGRMTDMTSRDPERSSRDRPQYA